MYGSFVLSIKKMRIRIALVDDKQVNRTTVKEKLMPYPEVEIVLEAINGEDFLEQLSECLSDLKPQVVLMDLEMVAM